MSENAHPRADAMDSLTTREILALMHGEDMRAVKAVQPALGPIADAIEQISARLRSGGRLHYFGAGTSGRLAALDAAECPSTFGVPPEMVQAHAAAHGEAADHDRMRTAEAPQAAVSPRNAGGSTSAR